PWTGRIRPFVAGLTLCGLLLAGCAPTLPPQADERDSYSAEVMATVLGAGLDIVESRYIEPVSAVDLAIGALNGLGVMDPDFLAARDGNAIRIDLGGHALAAIPDVDHGDRVTLAVQLALAVEQAREASPIIRRASDEALLEALFDGMLAGLDVFSRYAGEAEAQRNRDQRDGFDGVGVSYRMRHGRPQVTVIMEGAPAARQGLQAGDVLEAIDGHPTKGLTSIAVANLLRGEIGSKVTLTYRRGSLEPKAITLTRIHIVPETVTTAVEHGVIGFRLSSFNQETADRLAARLKSERAKLGRGFMGVVLDLRGNPGGLLRQSVDVADLFLERGPIISTRGRHRDSLQFYEAGGRDIAEGRPLVILVDGRTASAAEVVAAALQDRGRAAVIGTTSFGKGTVQTVARLPNDGELTLTWSRLVAPSGYVIHGLGVIPKVCLSDSADMKAGLGSLTTARTEPPTSPWRTAAFEDKPSREAARSACPPEDREDPSDWQAAFKLIFNANLYRRALDAQPGNGPDAPQAAALPKD
ncbi:MAG: S41 family peptidase, partial [Rhodospirillales bacterium]